MGKASEGSISRGIALVARWLATVGEVKIERHDVGGEADFHSGPYVRVSEALRTVPSEPSKRNVRLVLLVASTVRSPYAQNRLV
jgi:hypothetical protein